MRDLVLLSITNTHKKSKLDKWGCRNYRIKDDKWAIKTTFVVETITATMTLPVNETESQKQSTQRTRTTRAANIRVIRTKITGLVTRIL
jgi:hypothetical protein